MDQILSRLISAGPVIPVLCFESVNDAKSTGGSLYERGFRAFEITLRTGAALASIDALAKDLPDDAIVGAGTIRDGVQVTSAKDAGATFLVSPGLTASLHESVTAHGLPLLPGIATVSEAMKAREYGYRFLKFFPAETSGGVTFLKSIGAVLQDLTFCPTGGLTRENYKDYLALPNVPVVGGSWVTATDGADME